MTTRRKESLKPLLEKKQKGKCLFCAHPLISSPPNDELKTTFDHLDNNNTNNEEYNLALAHKQCNKAKRYNSDYQIIAKEQLTDNINSFDSLGVCADNPHKTTTKEIDISVLTWKTTKQYINERLLTQNKPALDLNQTAHAISYLVKEQSNHGSFDAAKKHILDYCSPVAPFECVEESGSWVIRKREKKG